MYNHDKGSMSHALRMYLYIFVKPEIEAKNSGI